MPLVAHVLCHLILGKVLSAFPTHTRVIWSGRVTWRKNLVGTTSLEDFEMCPYQCDRCLPVMLAIREGKLAMLKWLLEDGCTGCIKSCPAHFRRRRGYSALISVCDNP